MSSDASHLVAGIAHLQTQVRSCEPQLAELLRALVARYNEDIADMQILRVGLIQLTSTKHLQTFNEAVNTAWVADYEHHARSMLAENAWCAVNQARPAFNWTNEALVAVLEGWGRLISK